MVSPPTCPTAGKTTSRGSSTLIPPRLDEYDDLMTDQPIWRERLQGVGVITTAEAIALGATGPILRSTGVAWDLRRDHAVPRATTRSSSTSIVGTYGDSFDRYAIRLNEIRESIRIVRQILEKMPAATTASRTRRSPRRRGPASTSRWKR